MRDYCTLTLGRETYGIPFNLLREVIEPLPCTRVPMTSDVVRGVVNLRGDLTPVLVLDSWLGLATSENQLARRPWTAFFTSGNYRFGVLVDKVGTARAEDEELTMPAEGEARLFEGVVGGESPLRILRVPSLLQQLESELSSEAFSPRTK